jgi:cytochrome c553
MKAKSEIIKALAIIGAIAVICGAYCFVELMLAIRHGFSARGEPSRLETFLASNIRYLSISRQARELANPVKSTPQVLTNARLHWADHCATCHGNDGRGETIVSAGMSPKPPNMRLPATQELTDGELYYLIQNGVRMTGMPAWGDADDEKSEDSWALVHFIRHIPSLSQDELDEMAATKPEADSDIKNDSPSPAALEQHEHGGPSHEHGKPHSHHH